MSDTNTQDPPKPTDSGGGGDTASVETLQKQLADLQKQNQQLATERDHFRKVVSERGQAEPPKDTPPGGEAPKRAESFDAAIEASGLMPHQLAARYRQDGSLSEGEYRLLEQQGYSRADADRMIQSDIATLDRATAEAAREVGGEDALKKLVDQMDSFVPEARQGRIRELLSNPATMAEAATLLKHHHNAKLGADNFTPILDGGGGGGGRPGGVEPYRDEHEAGQAAHRIRMEKNIEPADDPEHMARVAAMLQKKNKR